MHRTYFNIKKRFLYTTQDVFMMFVCLFSVLIPAQLTTTELAVLRTVHPVPKNIDHISQNDPDRHHAARHIAVGRLAHPLPHLGRSVTSSGP